MDRDFTTTEIWEFYCLEKLSSRSSSNNCNLRSFESFKLSPLFFAFYLFIFIYLFLLLFIYLFYLSFLHYADRSPVAIGIYPRGCVDRLL